jgi:CHAD domain-containing protein
MNLPKLLSKFYAAGRNVLTHEDPETLHQFRLRGKRVRYTLELFRPLYGPELDELLRELKQAQTALGDINDCSSAHSLVRNPRFRFWLAERQANLREQFRLYWRNEFDAPGREERWLEYLRRYSTLQSGRHNEHQPEDPDRQA